MLNLVNFLTSKKIIVKITRLGIGAIALIPAAETITLERVEFLLLQLVLEHIRGDSPVIEVSCEGMTSMCPSVAKALVKVNRAVACQDRLIVVSAIAPLVLAQLREVVHAEDGHLWVRTIQEETKLLGFLSASDLNLVHSLRLSPATANECHYCPVQMAQLRDMGICYRTLPEEAPSSLPWDYKYHVPC